jgi:hypothetical protein
VTCVIYEYFFNVNGVHIFGTCCKCWIIFYFIIWNHCILIKSNWTFCYLEPCKSSYLSFTADVKDHLRKHFVSCCIQAMYTMRVIRWERFPKWFFPLSASRIDIIGCPDWTCQVVTLWYKKRNMGEHLKLNPPKRTSILRANGLFSASKDSTGHKS